MKLYGKMLLSFIIVIGLAVSVVGLAIGRLVEREFRSYNALYSNRAQRTAEALKGYYAENSSWSGLQDHIEVLTPMGKGPSQGQGGGSPPIENWSYRVADASGRIIANFGGEVDGSLNSDEKRRALPLESEGILIGYLAMREDAPLEQPAEAFLVGLEKAVWYGIAIAFGAALLTAGLLTRGITAPVRHLTEAAEAISEGALESRAPVSGRDEIAQLARTFNTMAANLQHEEQLRQAQTADIAHELRNPLSILQGSLEALADGIYEPTIENIEPALDQVRTLNRLVEDLRTLALVDAGTLSLEKQPVNLVPFLQRVADAYHESFDEHQIELRTHLENSPLTVQVDYERLTQVVNNILGNALRYVTTGSILRIEAGLQDNGVLVSFIDNGPGVSATDLPHLFDRFWRGEPSRNRGTGGSGLGLTIARRIIEAHQGRIWAEATPGGGLTVRFWLPSI